MNCIVDNSITITDCPADLKAELKGQLQWANPDYIKRQEAGRSVWGCPHDIILWEQRGKDFIVPFGMLPRLFELGLAMVPAEHIMRSSNVQGQKIAGLYNYQENALESAIRGKQGVVVAPCGAGKTQIGIAICAAYGYRTLWLTHTHELLKQSMARAKQYLNIPIGTITAGKINVSEGITFATVQTMVKIDLLSFRNFWDVIIVDECHRCVGTPTQMTMFWKVVNTLSARHKYGLTATPKREDGMEKAMYALLGPIVHEVSRTAVKDKTVPLVVSLIKTRWKPNYDFVLNPDGTLNYVSLVTDCISNADRNKVIAETIRSSAEDGPTLVLSERVAHLQTLEKMCAFPSGNLSTSSKASRTDLTDDIKSGKIRVIFATYAIAKEGLDIPCLKHLIMASPVKNKITVVQSAGRVMRSFTGKEFGTLCDFEDDMPMLQRWLRTRLSIYKGLSK